MCGGGGGGLQNKFYISAPTVPTVSGAVTERSNYPNVRGSERDENCHAFVKYSLEKAHVIIMALKAPLLTHNQNKGNLSAPFIYF